LRNSNPACRTGKCRDGICPSIGKSCHVRLAVTARSHRAFGSGKRFFDPQRLTL
jgi:hypothetical protein